MKFKKTLLAIGTVATVAAPVAAVVACGSIGTDDVEYASYNGAKISKDNTYFVTDGGSLSDATFNQSVYNGALGAGMPGDVSQTDTSHALKAKTSADIGDSYENAKTKGASLIVASGFNHGTAMTEFSQEHSDMGFVFVDGTLEAVKKDGTKVQQGNVASIVFATEQAAFEEGVAAASAAAKAANHKIGVYGGMSIPSVNSYIKGLKAGVDYYNKNLSDADGQKVDVVDAGYVGNFAPGNQSQTKAVQLVDSTDIVMAVGGPQYVDVIAAIKGQNKPRVKLIGVDVDVLNVIKNSTERNYVFGSITKDLETMTKDVLTEIYADNGKAEFGTVTKGDITKGVGITNAGDLTTAAGELKTSEADIKAAAKAFTI